MIDPARNIIILGSSRRDGNTQKLARTVAARLDDVAIADLNDLTIAPYDYRHAHSGDDFLPLAQAMAKAENILFASPVYWYSMSAQMKALFDRLTDLTEQFKPVGKSLAGKTAWLIASGGSPIPPAAFEPPFRDTARYFNMHWGGMLYGQGGAATTDNITAFMRSLANSATELTGYSAGARQPEARTITRAHPTAPECA